MCVLQQRGVRPLPIMLQQPNKVATLDLAHYCMGNEIAAALAAGLNKRQGSVRRPNRSAMGKGVGAKRRAVCVWAGFDLDADPDGQQADGALRDAA